MIIHSGSVGAYFALALVQHSDHPGTQRKPLLLHDGNDLAARLTDRGRMLHAGICTRLTCPGGASR